DDRARVGGPHPVAESRRAPREHRVARDREARGGRIHRASDRRDRAPRTARRRPDRRLLRPEDGKARSREAEGGLRVRPPRAARLAPRRRDALLRPRIDDCQVPARHRVLERHVGGRVVRRLLEQPGGLRLERQRRGGVGVRVAAGPRGPRAVLRRGRNRDPLSHLGRPVRRRAGERALDAPRADRARGRHRARAARPGEERDGRALTTSFESPTRRAAASALAYVAVFAVLFHRWIAASAEATSAFNGQADNRLLPYLLAWVAQALATRPHDLFDAPMFFPARGMLTGSEHYLSLQLLFAPAYAWSRNPLLAANFVAMASFVIAAFAMERLLAAAGFAWWSAWLAGLVFGLGPLRYPASIQVIQNLKLFLPLTALAILLLRRRPTARRGASLVAALLAGLFASYYAALNVGLTAVLWTSLEAARPGPRRARFVALVAVALAISVALLAAFSRPYFERRRSFDALAAEAARVHATDVGEPAGVAAGDARNADGWFPFGPFARRFGAMTGAVAPALAVFGLLALAARDPGVRRIAAAGVAFAVAGLALALRFHSRALPSPLSELLGFYRFPWRFLVLFGFGIALLAGAGAEAAGRRFGARRATAASLAAAAILLVADGGKMMWVPLDRVTAIARDAGAYRAVGAIARANGEGPLAEVPRIGTARTDWQYDALLGSMLHGQPLVTGYTGYAPPHSGLVDSWLAELPSPVALADLADATQLRWLLVRPESDWADPVARRRLLAELDRNPEVGPPFEIGSWTLRRIDRAPR